MPNSEVEYKVGLHIEQDAFEYGCSVFGAPVVSAVLKDMDFVAARKLVEAQQKR